MSPSLARHEDGTLLAFGTPGGDQQDQWSLEFFLDARDCSSTDLQAAIDAPMFHTTHFPSSFYPRALAAAAGGDRGAGTGGDGRRRCATAGTTWRSPTGGRSGALSAVSRDAAGVLRGAANPRVMQGYAVGR